MSQIKVTAVNFRTLSGYGIKNIYSHMYWQLYYKRKFYKRYAKRTSKTLKKRCLRVIFFLLSIKVRAAISGVLFEEGTKGIKLDRMIYDKHGA